MLQRQSCRWALAREAFDNSLADWIALENGAGVAKTHVAIAIVEWKRGNLKAADSATRDALAIADLASLRLTGSFARQAAALIALHFGDFVESAEQLNLARGRNESQNLRSSLLSSEFLGDVHLEQGHAAEALKHYDEVWPKAMALVPKGDIVAELRRRRAECYLLLGRNDEAYAAAKEGLDHCRELGDRYEEAATYRVLALSAAAIGKHDEARQHFTQGFAYYDDIETPYEWGKLWMAYGDWLLGANAGPLSDRSAAREAYLAARDYFSNMGARAKLREAETRLRALDAEVAATATVMTEPESTTTSIARRPQRRPTSQTLLDRRSEGAWHDWYIITRHEPLLNILDRAAKLALSDVPILVTGETGTGKELVAAGIHRASKLAGTYVPLNCAAVPKEMIESELFGHVRGAFSGAIAERQGLVEMAAKGTLFLDEVGEMAEAMQAKLLRFLESGEYRRVGESVHRVAKTRLVAATNVSRDRLEKGEGFRHDLFWRLAQGVLEIPALRHRPGDVPVLVDHFLRIEARKMNKLSLTIGEAAQAELYAYAWPGNVRELVGVVRRAVALAERTIEPEHLDLSSSREVAVTLTEEMAAAERVKLARAMKENGDSPTAAARALGIPRTTLLMKLKRYGMR